MASRTKKETPLRWRSMALLLLLAGATLQRRDSAGTVIEEVQLPTPHFGGTIAEHPAGGVVVADGLHHPGSAGDHRAWPIAPSSP